MWEIVIKIISATLLSFSGAIVISNLSEIALQINTKNILLLMLLSLTTTILYKLNYEFYVPVVSCLNMTFFYKSIFKLNWKDSLWYTIMLLCIAMFAELLASVLIINFSTAIDIRGDNKWLFIGNLIISIIIVIISKIKNVKNKIQSFNNITINKNYNIPILFIFLLLIILSILMISVTINYHFNYKYLITILLMISVFVIGYIYIKEKIDYDNLNQQYDILLDCIQTFEDWIEKEQVSLHESKNQLIVLKSLVKNKKAAEYLSEIIKDKIVIENNWINDLKYIPNGGLKGLIYYKLSQSKIKNISIELNIQRDIGKELRKLSTILTKELCRIIGIYFDNAIEATETASKKIISLEIYMQNKNTIIVLSNYIDETINIDQINKKGYSTKGFGRGNGLFFAKKIIEENHNVFTEELLIKDDYYIKKLIIKPI